jgi:hypothetical protein
MERCSVSDAGTMCLDFSALRATLADPIIETLSASSVRPASAVCGPKPRGAEQTSHPGTASDIKKYIKFAAMMKTNRKNIRIHQIHQILHHTQMNKVLQYSCNSTNQANNEWFTIQINIHSTHE